MVKYDLVFGLGAACSCTEILRKAGLQFLSFPFDWLYGGTFLERARLLVAGGEGWLDQAVLSKQPSPEWHDKDIYLNTRTGIAFNHDFPRGESLDRSFPVVARRYARRFERLFQLIEKSKRALVVYISTPGASPMSDDELREGLKIVQDRFPKTVFDFLYFRLEKGVLPAERIVTELGEHIKVVAFDYKDTKPGRYDYLVEQSYLVPCFADLAVNDYRTEAEKKAYRRAKRLARYSKYGATNFVQFTVRRFMSHVADAWRGATIGFELAWKRRWFRTSGRRHAIFVSLGYNCELAFRYFRHNGFVDSGLFQWGYSSSIDQLVYAIEHLDLLFTGEIRDPRPLYQCANTLILQHGKTSVDTGGSDAAPSLVEVEAGREELRGRMAYLKKKFVKTLRDGGALVAYKVRTSEYLDDSAEEKLNRLISALRNLGMKDATFLLVCEQACRVKTVDLDWPDAHIRFVKAFNPDNCVTDSELGDSVGWQLIFDEFRPLTVKKQKHKFKFEK